jgi:hypothetical protein
MLIQQALLSMVWKFEINAVTYVSVDDLRYAIADENNQ